VLHFGLSDYLSFFPQAIYKALSYKTLMYVMTDVDVKNPERDSLKSMTISSFLTIRFVNSLPSPT
jgi:hypothetical protein